MRLRALNKKDAEGMLEWMKAPQIYRFFRFDPDSINMESVLQFIDNADVQLKNRSSVNMAIVNEEDEYLGTISLKNIDYSSLNAEYAISLRSMAQGKGIASWATQEILKVAFEDLMLKRVYLNVLSDNEKAIRCYEKNGFIYEGEFRKHIKLRGEIKSLKWYSMLSDEYAALSHVEELEGGG